MPQSPPIRVEDVMHSRFSLVDGLATVSDALTEIQRDGHHALIIRKRDEDDEHGLVLLSDIAKQVLARNRAPERVNLYEIMSKPVIAVGPRMQIRYCARLFERFGLTLAPVIDSTGEVIGMVGYDDLVLGGLRGQD
jgi:Mg/Co/Ni transporter MgtE